MHTRRYAVLVASSFLVIGCKAKLTSDVSVDGKVLDIDSCRSGEEFGFTGIELIEKSGTTRLRLVATPSGEANVVLFPDGTAKGTDLGACGPMKVERQNSQINDIYNVKGTATLDCTSGSTKVKGTITFENCH